VAALEGSEDHDAQVRVGFRTLEVSCAKLEVVMRKRKQRRVVRYYQVLEKGAPKSLRRFLQDVMRDSGYSRITKMVVQV